MDKIEEVRIKPVCVYCEKSADAAMLIMGNSMAHATCVIQKLNELLDPDYDGTGIPMKIIESPFEPCEHVWQEAPDGKTECRMCGAFPELKPDESRLLTDEENPYWYVNAGCYKPNCLQMYTDREIELLRMAFRDGSEAQDAQTARIKDAECQKRIERIFEEIESSDELLEIGRKAIEDTLIEWRDSRLSQFNRGNGLVIRERDGKDSNIIRFGPETALKIGLRAIRQALKKQEGV